MTNKPRSAVTSLLVAIVACFTACGHPARTLTSGDETYSIKASVEPGDSMADEVWVEYAGDRYFITAIGSDVNAEQFLRRLRLVESDVAVALVLLPSAAKADSISPVLAIVDKRAARWWPSQLDSPAGLMPANTDAATFVPYDEVQFLHRFLDD